MIHNLVTFQGGHEVVIPLDIKFVSRGVRRDIAEINNKICSYKMKFDEYTNLNDNIAADAIEKQSGFQEAVKKMNIQATLLEKEFKTFDFDEYETRKNKIFIRVLEDNGYDISKYDNNFFDNCIEPIEIQNFLMACFLKDMDKKKTNLLN